MKTSKPVALITGASSGIGRAIALELARRGYDLVVTARRTELLDSLAAEAGSTWRCEVETISADLRGRSGLETVAERASRGVEILVANAGFSSRGSFPKLPLELEIGQIELNIISTVVLCHAASAAMCARGSGRILITSSAASFQPLPGLATYGASKAFLTSFSLALDAELRPCGVTVSCLAPGFTQKQHGMPRPRPTALWRTSEEVAALAVDGLLKGQTLIVPGLAWRAVALLSPRMPRAVVRRMARALGTRMAQAGQPSNRRRPK